MMDSSPRNSFLYSPSATCSVNFVLIYGTSSSWWLAIGGRLSQQERRPAPFLRTIRLLSVIRPGLVLFFLVIPLWRCHVPLLDVLPLPLRGFRMQSAGEKERLLLCSTYSITHQSMCQTPYSSHSSGSDILDVQNPSRMAQAPTFRRQRRQERRSRGRRHSS